MYKDEIVQEMPPVSMAAIEKTANAVLEILSPEHLKQPGPLDLADWVDFKLQKFGIHVCPASIEELQLMEGCAYPAQNDEAEILIRDEQYLALFKVESNTNRARSTIIHEVSHAIIHVPVMRRRQKLMETFPELVAARSCKRGDIPPFKDPEWQAWALGGCLMAPRKTLQMLKGEPFSKVAKIYGMSEVFLEKHLRRLKNIDSDFSL